MVLATSLLHKPLETDSQGRAYTCGWRDALAGRMPAPKAEAPYYLGYTHAAAHLKAGNARVLWSIKPVTVPTITEEAA